MAKILLYGIDKPVFEVYRKCACDCGFMLIQISDKSIDKKVEEVFNLTDDEEGSHVEFNDSYMLMDGLSKEDILSYLKRLEEENTEYDGIKIIKTETNNNWSVRKLFFEASHEQNIMKKIFVLQEMLKQCNTLDYSKVPEEEQRIFKEQLMNAFMIINKREVNENELDKAIFDLSNQLKNINVTIN